MEKIEPITPEQQLLAFKNGHLKEYIGCLIRIRAIEKYDPNENVGKQQLPSFDGKVPVYADFKAKDALKSEQLQLKANAKFLCAIEEIEKEFKNNPKPWQQVK